MYGTHFEYKQSTNLLFRAHKSCQTLRNLSASKQDVDKFECYLCKILGIYRVAVKYLIEDLGLILVKYDVDIRPVSATSRPAYNYDLFVLSRVV